MMLGPMKKKVVISSIVAFLVPTIILGGIFIWYSQAKRAEIDDLMVRVAEGVAYAISGDFPIGHVIASEDLKTIEVKEQSIPTDSFYMEKTGEEEALDSKLLVMKNEIIGRKLRLAVTDTTMVTDSLFFDDEEDNISIDLREKEFNMITLPSDLEKGDFMDVRILFPTGEDYLVTAGKEVIRTGDNVDSNAIVLDLDEEEIVRVSSAIIESYMMSGVKLYATKYVNPYQQLFSETNEDYVEKYQNALNAIIEERTTEEEVETKTEETVVPETTSGEASGETSGDAVSTTQKKTEQTKKIVKVVPKEEDISDEDIAAYALIPLDDVKIIRRALKDKDAALIKKYQNKTVRKSTELVENYPVKKEVAALIKENPNIIEELKARYDVEALQAQRVNLGDLQLYDYDFDGKLTETENMTKIATALDKEIEAQRADRKQYLQSLLGVMPTAE